MTLLQKRDLARRVSRDFPALIEKFIRAVAAEQQIEL
jgi:hypothetical protein